MDARIESWICRYRLREPAARGRLDDLARGPVLAALESALRQAFGDDPTVYLVRRIDCHWAVNRAALGGDNALTQRWGEQLAAAVVRTIREDTGSGNVVCYPDRAAHVAAFVEELLAGRPGEAWTFAAFTPHRCSTTRETLRAVLHAHAEDFGTITARLQADGALLRLLQQLDRDTLRVLWATGIARHPAAPADTDRPLFATALHILERLGGPTIDRPRAEAWLVEFLAAHPAADWRDRRSLSEGVLAACRFLRFRPGQGGALDGTRLEATLADLDWLDVPWLRSQLENLLPAVGVSPRYTRQPRSITPRQQEILSALYQVLQRSQHDLDHHELDSPGNGILLFAALTVAQPTWASDPTTTQLVQTILRAAALLYASASRPELLAAIRQADFGSLARLLGPVACVPAQTIARLGQTAADCVEGLLPLSPTPAGKRAEGREPPARSHGEAVEGTATQAAGVFLLLRAVSDLRLPALVRHSEYPLMGASALGRLLVALTARWAGLSLQHGLDPGLALLAGADPTTVQDWFAQPIGDDQSGAWRFQQALAEVALGHGLLDARAPLRVALAVSGGTRFLLGGDEAAQVWPFVAPLAGTFEAGGLIRQWAAQWEKLTQKPPRLVVPESLAAQSPPGTVVELCTDAPAELTALLEFLDVGSVGLPWFDATVTAAAPLVMRAWGRWLKQLGGSSVPYLLGQFIRRAGSVVRQETGLLVELEPRPLDVVLQLSGYLEPVELLVGLPVQRVLFRLRAVP